MWPASATGPQEQWEAALVPQRVTSALCPPARTMLLTRAGAAASRTRGHPALSASCWALPCSSSGLGQTACLGRTSRKAQDLLTQPGALCSGAGRLQQMRRTGGTGSEAASGIHSPLNLCCALSELQDLVIHAALSQSEVECR